jgi:membrane fusion protein (multidrug efflux system)
MADGGMRWNGALAAARPRLDRKRVLIVVAAAAALAVAVLLSHFILIGRHLETTENAYLRADISPVSSKVEGYVRQVLVKDNQAVEADQPLVLIEDADYAARLARARADLAAAQANLTGRRASALSASEQTGQQAAAIARARAAVEAAQADRARLAADRVRYQTLFDKGLVAKARLDLIDAQSKQAAAAEAAARAELSWQSQQTGVLAAGRSRAGGDVAAAEAAVEAAEAALSAAALDMERTILRAPIAGIVAARTVQEGQLLRPGTQAMAIVPVQAVYIVANFKETQVAKMRPGAPARVKIDAFGGAKINGRVESLAPASGAQFSIVPQDTATGNFTKIVQRIPVKIALDPAPALAGRLRPGLSAVVTIDTKAQ